MEQVPFRAGATFDELLSVVRRLRDPHSGCPWDREQTHFSLLGDLIEESYEVIDAIESEGVRDLIEELGDLLLQVCHHVVIAEEDQEFLPKDVFAGIINKLIRRHPHVFAFETLTSSTEVLQQWEKIKQEERNQVHSRDTPFSGLPRAMPALIYAQKTQVRAASLGLDWETVTGAFKKIEEESKELNEATSLENREAEMGDLLFSVVNVARWMEIDAEGALRAATQRFQSRTGNLVSDARDKNIDLLSASPVVKDRLWDAAKDFENKD